MYLPTFVPIENYVKDIGLFIFSLYKLLLQKDLDNYSGISLKDSWKDLGEVFDQFVGIA